VECGQLLLAGATPARVEAEQHPLAGHIFEAECLAVAGLGFELDEVFASFHLGVRGGGGEQERGCDDDILHGQYSAPMERLPVRYVSLAPPAPRSPAMFHVQVNR